MVREPLVSVVVPVYNKEEFVEPSLETVLEQSVRDIEVICVDDGSTDATLERLRRLQQRDSRVRIHALPRNRGAAHARNVGLSLAAGRFVSFFDADDFYPADALEVLVDLATRSGSSLVRGSMVFRDARGNETQWTWQRMPSRTGVRLLEEPALWLPWGFTCYLFRREFLVENGCAFPALVDGEDPVFLARCLTKTETVSTTATTTYIYNTAGNRKSPRNTFRHLTDFVHHARAVRAIFHSSGHSVCWREGCGPVYLDDVLRKQARLPSRRERTFIALKAFAVWHRDAGKSPIDKGMLLSDLVGSSTTGRKTAEVMRMSTAALEMALDGARAERNKARAERDKANAERDKARAERDKVRAERDQARAERDKARAERDQAQAERDKVEAQRDRARRGRNEARRERDKAVSELDAMLSSRSWRLTAGLRRLGGHRR